jgi:hypothetical protein
MAIARIENWIHSGTDFDEGVEIYRDMVGDPFILKLFDIGSNTFTRQKLREQLEKLNEKAKAKLAGEALLKQAQTEDLNSGGMQAKSKDEAEQPFARRVRPREQRVLNMYPPGLQKKIRAKGRYFREASERRAYLRTLEEPVARARELRKIKNLFGKIERVWNEVEFFEQNGIELRQEDDKFENIAQIQKKLLNVRTLVSKYQGRPEKKALFDKYFAERNRLQALIDEYGIK